MYKLYLEKNITSKDLLEKILKENNIHDRIIYNEYGKPYLKNNAIYFNISHSGIYTALVIADTEVGIDIEKIQMPKNALLHVCTEEERKLINNAEDFTLMWVKKESYVKYLGIGISYGLKNVDTIKIKDFIIKKVGNYYVSIYGKNLK